MNVHGVIDHIGHAEKTDLGLEDLLVWVEITLLEKLKEWENKMAIQVRRDSGGEIVGRHGSSFAFSLSEKGFEAKRERF